MKKLLVGMVLLFTVCLQAQTVKLKAIKLKYTLPAGWNAEVFGGEKSWDEPGNNLCHCSGVLFTKQNSAGVLKVLVYPSDVNGLDSTKRNQIGLLKFTPVEKYDKVRNKNFSFEKRKSNFVNVKTNAKTYEVIRYKAKVEDHFYLFYAWQENTGSISPDTEKELFGMINVIEPL